MRWQLLIKQGIIFLFAIFTIGQVKADTFIPKEVNDPNHPLSEWKSINFQTSVSYSGIKYNYITQHNHKIFTQDLEISYTFLNEERTKNSSIGWVIKANSGWTLYTMPDGTEVYRQSSTSNFGYIIKINNIPVKNGFLDSGIIINDSNIPLTAKINVEAIEIEPKSNSSALNDSPSFVFFVTPAYLFGGETVIYDSTYWYKSFRIYTNNPAGGSPYISFCQTINSPDPSNVTLADITTKEFLSSSRSQVYSTFKLSVKNCGVKNNLDDWWRNDVEAVYVTFSDANGSSSSTILKNTGTAKGVGFSIYPEGSEQPVKFSAPNTEIYGTPEDNNPLKNDGTATEMNYTKNSETVTVPKRLGYYDSYTVVLGSAEKTFRVYYARDPSQGEEVKAGSVVGKATFTFSYQ